MKKSQELEKKTKDREIKEYIVRKRDKERNREGVYIKEKNRKRNRERNIERNIERNRERNIEKKRERNRERWD